MLLFMAAAFYNILRSQGQGGIFLSTLLINVFHTLPRTNIFTSRQYYTSRYAANIVLDLINTQIYSPQVLVL